MLRKTDAGAPPRLRLFAFLIAFVAIMATGLLVMLLMRLNIQLALICALLPVFAILVSLLISRQIKALPLYRPAAEYPGRAFALTPAELDELKLSPREKEVAALLLQGLTMRQIGVDLGISESTVNGYCGTLYKKLGINSRAELFMRFGAASKPNTRPLK